MTDIVAGLTKRRAELPGEADTFRAPRRGVTVNYRSSTCATATIHA